MECLTGFYGSQYLPLRSGEAMQQGRGTYRVEDLDDCCALVPAPVIGHNCFVDVCDNPLCRSIRLPPPALSRLQASLPLQLDRSGNTTRHRVVIVSVGANVLRQYAFDRCFQFAVILRTKFCEDASRSRESRRTIGKLRVFN